VEGALRGGRCARHGHRSRPCGVSSAWHRPHDGGWPPGKLHSVRLPKPGQAASGRGQSNQMLSEVLRAGRASTAGLSPLSTPDSILICFLYTRRERQYCQYHVHSNSIHKSTSSWLVCWKFLDSHDVSDVCTLERCGRRG